MGVEGRFIHTSFEFEDKILEVLIDFTEENELFNQSSLLFLEERYMEECEMFSKVIDKFKTKKFNKDLLIFRNNAIQKLANYNSEVELFKQVISENNINGLNKNDLNISVKHFEVYEKSEKVKFIQLLFILLFLSNTTEYDDNHFTFKVIGGKEEIIEELAFDQIKTYDLVEIYHWIIGSKENLQTRLKIIRDIIVRKKSLDLSGSDLLSAKSAFNLIIKEETEKYFKHVNMLKDDFLKLSERKENSYQALHLKFLGWCSTIALFIYSELKDKENGNLLKKLLFSITEKGNIFLVIFIFSLIVIWLIFVSEMNKNKKEYRKIKEIYTNQLFFEEKDFSNCIEPPEISILYNVAFYLILTFLVLRLFLFLFI